MKKNPLAYKMLIEKGANPLQTDDNKHDTMAYAVQHCAIDILVDMIKSGYSVPDWTDELGNSLLMSWCVNSDFISQTDPDSASILEFCLLQSGSCTLEWINEIGESFISLLWEKKNERTSEEKKKNDRCREIKMLWETGFENLSMQSELTTEDFKNIKTLWGLGKYTVEMWQHQKCGPLPKQDDSCFPGYSKDSILEIIDEILFRCPWLCVYQPMKILTTIAKKIEDMIGDKGLDIFNSYGKIEALRIFLELKLRFPLVLKKLFSKQTLIVLTQACRSNHMHFLIGKICCRPSDKDKKEDKKDKRKNADNPFVNLPSDVINHIYSYNGYKTAIQPLNIPCLHENLIKQTNDEKMPSHWSNLDIEKEERYMSKLKKSFLSVNDLQDEDESSVSNSNLYSVE